MKISNLNKPVEILTEIEINDILNHQMKNFFEFYNKELNILVTCTETSLKIVVLDAKSKELKKITLFKGYTAINASQYMNGYCRKNKLGIYDFIRLIVKENLKEVDNFEYTESTIEAKRTFNPFKKYNRVELHKKTKLNKLDIVKILMNNQYESATCEHYQSEDDKGLVGNMYLAKELIESDMPTYFNSIQNEISVGHYWLSYKIEL